MSACSYCGTPLNEYGENPADGHYHGTATCREYINGAKDQYKRELSEALGKLSAIAGHARAIVAAQDRWAARQADLAVRLEAWNDIEERARAIAEMCEKGGGK